MTRKKYVNWLGDTLRSKREALGLSLQDVADAAELSKLAIENYAIRTQR